MDWLKEILTAKGIEVSEELIADVQKELPKHFIPKREFNLKIEENNELKTQIATRDKDIEELKKAATGDAELTAKYEELQGKYDKDTKDLQDKLAQTQFNAAFDVALAGSGAKNTKALRALFDMDKIKYENDTLNGFNEQLEVIKKENDYLFEGETKSSGGMRHGSGISSEDSFIAGMREGAGLKE